MLQRVLNISKSFIKNINDHRQLSKLSINGNLCSPVPLLRNLSSISVLPKVTNTTETLDKNEHLITQDVIANINEQIKSGKEGRLFAVVHICGKQFKVTPEDIIIIEGYWPPENGDEIKCEKVLLIGGLDFTLVGRPILPQGLATVTATVIEKDLSHTKTIFFKRRRKQYQRINFFRSQLTMLRINEVSVTGKINEHSNITQYERI
ncbi:large ribosomal subunit protein bL21 isoform X1 [Halyomorpha halys]|uniref:large ribosomal subunit protein bL21 isoform X1 n=1 Tax=Halyomorpha halys TaxID=286706 RepID=UPI0006D52731|nr:39S ribosomal protein L21, mitochondrial [Halyomorpha halys]